MNEAAKLRPALLLLRLCVLCLALMAGTADARAQRSQDLTTATPLPKGDTLIVGFMGQRES